MKKNSLILFSLVLLTIQSSAQQFEFEKEGFLHNTKLSALKAQYLFVTFARNANGDKSLYTGLIAYDGEIPDKVTNYLVTNQSGEKLIFKSMPSIISFFGYNGWELIGKAADLIAPSKDYEDCMVFKKKNK